MEHTKKKVAVIGAGIAGLSAAYTLKKGGADVVVYEADSRVGGRMYSKHKDSLAFDCGADFFVAGYSQMKLYAHELGLEWIPTLPGSTHRVYRNGEFHFYDFTGIIDVLKLKVLTPLERIKFLYLGLKLKLVYKNLLFYELYSQPDWCNKESAAEFLRKNVGQAAVDYLADPFTAIMQFHLSDELSAGTLLSHLSTRVNHPEDFLVRYTKGGIDMIAKKLAAAITLRSNTPVISVRKKEGALVCTTAQTEENYDAVVIAAPAPAAAKITDYQYASKLFKEATYATTIVLSYKISLNTFPNNTHFTYIPKVENKMIAGYSNESRKGDDIRDGETTLLLVYLHETAAQEMIGKSDEEIFSIVSAELPTVCPELTDRIFTPHDLQRWPLAMPKFSPNHMKNVSQFMKNDQGKDNIYFIGDYMGAVWTEGAARLGKKTAETILEKLK